MTTRSQAAITALRAGQIVAVKGIGGFHLAVDAADEEAVAELRRRKARDDKPFAVMVADLAAARDLCVLSDAAVAQLTGPGRPIVLAPRQEGAAVAAGVAPGLAELGLSCWRTRPCTTSCWPAWAGRSS